MVHLCGLHRHDLIVSSFQTFPIQVQPHEGRNRNPFDEPEVDQLGGRLAEDCGPWAGPAAYVGYSIQ